MSLCVILFLSGLASLVTATNETICEALEQHRYQDLALLSITPFGGSGGLLIFTQPGFRYYRLRSKQVTYGTMDLSEAYPHDLTKYANWKEAFSPVKHHSHKGTYIFFLFHPWQWSIFHTKLLILIVTDKGTRTGSYNFMLYYSKGTAAFTEITMQGTPLPDFTLAGIGYDKSKDLSGYVISADSDRFPGFIILSQYKVLYEGSKVTGLPLPAGQTDDRPFFFLQVMDHPFEVFLVHSSNSPDPEGQLLRSVPRSFLYDKKHLVLFDSVNGCVHIIAHFGGFDVTGTKSRVFKRSNYPFEVYFKCSNFTHITNPNPNRCNVVRGSHRPTGTTPESPETPTTESVVFSMGRTASVCLVLVAVLAVGLLYAIMTKKKGKGATKGRSTGKSLTSSSAVSSTSKPSSKSKTGSKSTLANSSISGPGARSKSKSTSKGSKKRETSKTCTSK